jgi:hypothetical protein
MSLQSVGNMVSLGNLWTVLNDRADKSLKYISLNQNRKVEWDILLIVKYVTFSIFRPGKNII